MFVFCSPCSGHPRFFNQLSSGLDIIGLAGEWLTSTANTNMWVSLLACSRLTHTSVQGKHRCMSRQVNWDLLFVECQHHIQARWMCLRCSPQVAPPPVKAASEGSYISVGPVLWRLGIDRRLAAAVPYSISKAAKPQGWLDCILISGHGYTVAQSDRGNNPHQRYTLPAQIHTQATNKLHLCGIITGIQRDIILILQYTLIHI